ncbi:Swt1 family HEPN domain-containing protein [candidate division KSB1 bacterium]
MKLEDRIKLFGMSHSLFESDLDKVEQKLKIDLKRDIKEEKDDIYYPQFSHALRQEAAEMGKHYELFYCLEKSIRSLIAETLESEYGENWWESKVPDEIKKNVKNNIKKELDSGITLRSEEEIDYTTFGELSEVVRKNWDDFPIFSSQKAFNKIMTSLNILRGPIAHCCVLAEDEIVRLKLTVKDWFRLME